MHRIDGQGATQDNRFTKGNPSTGQIATVVTDDWLNDVQEAICAVIEAAGITLEKGDYSQLLEAIQALFDPQVDLSAFVKKGGDVMSGALTINLATAGLPLKLQRGDNGVVAVMFADTDTTKYFGMNGSGDFVVANQANLSDGKPVWHDGNIGPRISALVEDATPDLDDYLATSAGKKAKIRSILSAVGQAPTVILEDHKNEGTAGGTFNSGAWRIRDLGAIRNVDNLATVSNNEFTLPAGSYYIEFDAPAFDVGRHKARLYNVTDGATAIEGTAARTGNAGSADNPTTRSFGGGYVSIAATTTFRVEHRCEGSRSTDGFGEYAGWGTEVYSRVRIWPLP
ncbi:hypothetical protein HW532_15760 [Kaustia mangrovi]|uniref:Tail fiber protein n=1 Tax=Kaustia mangrovi TaxID=2593653 RepID=A0A7S8C5Z8_9HYPH|nr:hypothetical protein [Kaustia mangrovi]QPC44018.1 hypothetical protein HW532_15760 [Kaustia mangrovi]